MSFREKLASRAKKAGITVPEASLSPLETYFSLLQKWNLKVSLTSLPVQEATDEAIDRLLIEPLAAVPFFPKRARLWVDIGSGGGSPAIPMKIARPGIALHMVESRSKKATFLREAVRQLELPAAEVHNCRVEDMVAAKALVFRELVDVVTIRAVKLERELIAALSALLSPNGCAVLFRSETSERALAPGFEIEAEHPLLPSLGSTLQVIRKSS